MFPFQIMLAILCGWLQREQESVIAFLREENRVLKAQLAGRRLAELGYRLGPPNCNAHAERFVRSIKRECLDRVVPLSERHLRHLVREFVDHYHTERNHQGFGNELIERPLVQRTGGPVHRRWRVGGVLNYYSRSAA